MAEDSTQPPQATRFIETTRGILSYSQPAPLLAERVLKVQQDIEEETFAARPLDEALLFELHGNICGDLTPDWAGRFRTIEVIVGPHTPPLAREVPLLIRNYFGDLTARLGDPGAPMDPLLTETLAFAEGRLLSIHPFFDFNGRVTRLMLAELLRRMDLPLVELAPTTGESRARYLRALRAADSMDWKPLADVWRERLEKE